MSSSTPFGMAQPILSKKPVATVVGSKRPAPSISPDNILPFDIKKEEEDCPVRKRANLDHLSPEERLMRRKLKNRVAAQTARDKKKAQTDEMEIMIQQLKEDRQKMLEESSRLQAVNTQLQLDNASSSYPCSWSCPLCLALLLCSSLPGSGLHLGSAQDSCEQKTFDQYQSLEEETGENTQ